VPIRTGGVTVIHKNIVAAFSRQAFEPQIDPTAFVHPQAAVIGHVRIGKRVMVAPFASIRGDEGQPIFVNDDANIQDGVVLHALETEHNGAPVDKNLVCVDGQKFAVFVGRQVSLAHQSQIHGPALIGDETFIGMQSLVFRASVGHKCVVEPGCILMGVTVENGRYVPAGSVIKSRKDAEALPHINDDYPLKGLNQGVVQVNTRLAAGYNEVEIK